MNHRTVATKVDSTPSAVTHTAFGSHITTNEENIAMTTLKTVFGDEVTTTRNTDFVAATLALQESVMKGKTVLMVVVDDNDESWEVVDLEDHRAEHSDGMYTTEETLAFLVRDFDRYEQTVMAAFVFGEQEAWPLSVIFDDECSDDWSPEKVYDLLRQMRVPFFVTLEEGAAK